MLEKLLCKQEKNQQSKTYMLKKAFTSIIILRKTNIWLTKKLDLDIRDFKDNKTLWWTNSTWWGEIEEWVVKCLWIWWYLHICLWCKICNPPWEEIMEVCPWEVVWEETEEPWEEEVDNKEWEEEECNKDLKEIWWIIWICNNQCKLPLSNKLPLNRHNL